MIPEA